MRERAELRNQILKDRFPKVKEPLKEVELQNSMEKLLNVTLFPRLLVLYVNYTVITVHLLQEKLLALEKRKILLPSMIKMQI